MRKLPVNEAETVALLQELIRINSVNPDLVRGGSGEYQIARFLGHYLREMGLEVEYQEIKPGRPNVIGRLKGSGGGQTLMLNGHTDTVALTGMEIAPLDPRVADGKIYGRGSLDMKGGLAAMIAAARTLVDSGVRLKGDLLLALVVDEEYASLGTEALVTKYTADAAIICEPTNLEIVIAHKGFAWIRIEISGQSAHGSRPDLGIDAIVKAGKLLTALEDLQCNILSRQEHPLLGSPSVHASLISGGTELSTYPDYCRLELERRTLPHETKESVTEEIRALLDRLSRADEQFRAGLEVFFYRPGLEVAEDQPIVESLRRAFTNCSGESPRLAGMGGWMDSAILAAAGIPSVIFGPAGAGLHAAVEYVDCASVIETAAVLSEVIIDYCGAHE